MRSRPAGDAMLKVNCKNWLLISQLLFLTSCSNVANLASCWDANSFKTDDIIRGRVLLYASSVGGLIAYPASCQKVGFGINPSKIEIEVRDKMGAKLMIPIEKFAFADIEGRVTTAAGPYKRPKIDLQNIHKLSMVAAPGWFGKTK